jgi:ethanolamine ammonia-lyase small subunit
MSKASNNPKLSKESLVIDNPWQTLKQFTSARIGLGRAGNSIPTNELLSFQLDHAQAIDAVHKALQVDELYHQLDSSPTIRQLTSAAPFVVKSKAANRMTYLQRPDLGRQLDDHDWQLLARYQSQCAGEVDLAIVVADGLSSIAIQNHAVQLLDRLFSRLSVDKTHDWSVAPVTIVTQGRVAVGDDVGECLNAKITMILIGERPGLTSPDSLGIYMTWNPKRGTKESDRNCISNIRPEGLDYDTASEKAFWLLSESIKLGLSGINLKDRSTETRSNSAIENKDMAEISSSAHFLVHKRE